MEKETGKQADEKVKEQAEEQPESSQLAEEMAKWETKIDEAKVQMNLGAKDAKDKIQPYIEELEQELNQAKEQWEKLEKSSENAWNDIKRGLNFSMKAMKRSFEKAKEHFPDEEKK